MADDYLELCFMQILICCSKELVPILLIAANLEGLVKKGSLTQDKMNKALSLLKGVLDYSEFKHVDMVIEVSIPTHSGNLLDYSYCNLEFIFLYNSIQVYSLVKWNERSPTHHSKKFSDLLLVITDFLYIFEVLVLSL